MIISAEKVLRYYLNKQFLSNPAKRDLNILDIVEKTGFPKEKNLLLSLYLRKSDFDIQELKKVLINNDLIEIRTFRNKRLLVPQDLVRDFIKFIPQKNYSQKIKVCAQSILQKLNNEPQNPSQIRQDFSDYSQDIKKSALDYLEMQGKILKIYNFADKKFDLVPIREILGPELKKFSQEESLTKILHKLILFYGPLKVSDLVKFTCLNQLEIRRALRKIKKSIATFKISKSQSLYLIDGKDLANLQKFKEKPTGYLNIIPRSDHALSFSQSWLANTIPLYFKLESVVVFNGQVVGGYTQDAGFDNFTALPKSVLNEISKKHLSLLQWMKRRID